MLRQDLVAKIDHGYHHADWSEILATVDLALREARAEADAEYAADWAHRQAGLCEQVHALGVAQYHARDYNSAITDVLSLLGCYGGTE
jgi:hypothetical protein